jgi:thiosulfate/3-mercaptopyruvate sulfurtransferase
MSGYANDVLVETSWLAENLEDPNLKLLEVDEDTTAYDRGHIPGAIGINWKEDLQDALQRDFLSAEDFAKLQDKLGITPDSLVVLYGGNNNWFASYAYWYYRYYQHANVKLLDGGRKKWELEGRELTKEEPKVSGTKGYPVPSPDDEIRAFRDQILTDILGKDGKGLVDVRSPEEFRGELLAPAHLPQEQSQVGGHIPGAKNIPWGKNVNTDTGQFLPPEELIRLYEEEGITPDQEVVAYCRIGERSALTWFVLHELLGWDKVRNYDGSWTEWGSLVRAPVER